MPNHTKKRKNIFNLTESQMLYAQKMLPKTYCLVSLQEMAIEKKGS